MLTRAILLILLSSAHVVLSQPDGQIYWSNLSGIHRANLDGTGVEKLVESDQRWPFSIAVDEVTEKLYWTHGRSGGSRIYRSNLDGSDLEEFTGDLIPQTYYREIWHSHIAIDSARRIMFVALFLQDGGNDQHWAACAVFGIHLDKWTRPREGVFPLVRDINYDEIIGGYPTALTLDVREHRLFYTDHLSGLYMVDVDSAFVYDSGLVYPYDPSTLHTRHTRIASPEQIGRATEPVFDPVGQTLYWINDHPHEAKSEEMKNTRGLIWRLRFMDDGSKEYSLFLKWSADQLALDLETRKLYWSYGRRVYRTDIDDSDGDREVDRLFETDRSIENLIVSRGTVYWIDRRGNLRRSNLDGSDREEVFAPLLRRPGCLFVDRPRGKILWVDNSEYRMFQANMDGSDTELLVSNRRYCEDLAVADDKIYWAQRHDTVWRADRDGSNAREFLRASSPKRLVIDPLKGRVYYTDDNESFYRDSLSRPDPRLLLNHRHRPPRDMYIDSREGSLYVLDSDKLYRINVDTGDTTWVYRVNGGLTVDVIDDRIYMIRRQYHRGADVFTLQLSNKDGTGLEEIRGPDFPDLREEGWLYEWNFPFFLDVERAVLILPSDKTSVSSQPPAPHATTLHPNYPNPFNSVTEIRYTLSHPGQVSLVVYNALGQPVQTLVDGVQAAGSYRVPWHPSSREGKPLASGLYLSRLTTPESAMARKMTLLR
ncbi:MAG: DUF5050 domain-containing protein [Gemmatimonadaceae bacterium]|nr:DUF5050 domain-containing protein [Gemmatimonadaceae bacterium]